MPLEASFRELTACFGRVRAALAALQPELAGDQEMEILVARMLPILDDAISAARRGHKATADPVNLDRLQAMLPRCQERFNTAMAQFRGDLASPARAEALHRAGRDRLLFALAQCQQPFFDTGWSLFHCGQDLVAYIRLTRSGEE